MATWLDDPIMATASADARLQTDIKHLDGVPWWEAPVPSRFHRCAPQSRMWLNYFTLVERCACGASRYDGRDGWADRNSRKGGR